MACQPGACCATGACTQKAGVICVCVYLRMVLTPVRCFLVCSDVGDGTWGGTNPAMPWDWKGGKIDSGVYDNVLPDADAHK